MKEIRNFSDKNNREKIDAYLLKESFVNDGLYGEYLSYLPNPLPQHSLFHFTIEWLVVFISKITYVRLWGIAVLPNSIYPLCALTRHHRRRYRVIVAIKFVVIRNFLLTAFHIRIIVPNWMILILVIGGPWVAIRLLSADISLSSLKFVSLTPEWFTIIISVIIILFLHYEVWNYSIRIKKMNNYHI